MSSNFESDSFSSISFNSGGGTFDLDVHGSDMAMTSSTTSGKNPYFSKILENIRNTMQKNRLSLPSPSPEKLLAEIHELKKTDLSMS